MMSISPVGRAMRGSALKSTKLRVIWGILEIVRYRMRSESDVEFSMLDLLLTAPANTHKVNVSVTIKASNRRVPLFVCPHSSLTRAAAAWPDTRSPVLSLPVGPHGFDLVYRGCAPHAVEAFPRAAVWQGAVGAWGVWVEAEAEAVMGRDAGWWLGQGTRQVGSVWRKRRWRMGYSRPGAQ